MKQQFFLLVIASLFVLCGCASGPLPQSISNNPLIEVAVIGDGLFAADRYGHKVAVIKDGLYLLDLDSGSRQKLSTDHPVALAWNPDGSTLVASFPVAEYETRLRLYSAQGELLHETMLPVALSQAVWSARGDLLVTGFALKIFSFGGDLLQMLYRVDGEKIVPSVLSNTTLKLATVKRLSSIMQNVQPVAFSSFGDELIYAHLHDPPQFLPYLQLLYQNWQVGGGRSLQEIPLQKLHVTWGESDSSIAVHSASGVHEIALWPNAEDVAKQRVISRHRFIDGRLYEGEELLVDWGEGAHLQILAAGRFLLAVKNVLYRGDGLQAELPANDSEQAWLLRRWRFEGLITADEYQKLLRKESP